MAESLKVAQLLSDELNQLVAKSCKAQHAMWVEQSIARRLGRKQDPHYANAFMQANDAIDAHRREVLLHACERLYDKATGPEEQLSHAEAMEEVARERWEQEEAAARKATRAPNSQVRCEHVHAQQLLSAARRRAQQHPEAFKLPRKPVKPQEVKPKSIRLQNRLETLIESAAENPDVSPDF